MQFPQGSASEIQKNRKNRSSFEIHALAAAYA
jgi:hypothetical protein